MSAATVLPADPVTSRTLTDQDLGLLLLLANGTSLAGLARHGFPRRQVRERLSALRPLLGAATGRPEETVFLAVAHGLIDPPPGVPTVLCASTFVFLADLALGRDTRVMAARDGTRGERWYDALSRRALSEAGARSQAHAVYLHASDLLAISAEEMTAMRQAARTERAGLP
ncbi:hypothetical protein ACQPZG_32110 [Streptomyces sp. CA-294286]|uniref:hypothetical protein n=1 Tax=Streptomyces sp. CA-294286 TaxID=3240070 RepID=UPI003D92662E